MPGTTSQSDFCQDQSGTIEARSIFYMTFLTPIAVATCVAVTAWLRRETFLWNFRADWGTDVDAGECAKEAEN